jgi:hypothetical protein
MDSVNRDNTDSDDDEFDYSSPTPTNSPPRKRKKPNTTQTISEAHQPDRPPLNFEAFEILPVFARNKTKWNRILVDNKSFWRHKCESWCTRLKAAYEMRNVRVLN